MYLLLLWSGKLIQKASRLFHNSGAALPGLVVEHFMPSFLERALKKLPRGLVVISGTNGKTTTTKIVAETLESFGMRVMTNRSGSNMTRGLISTVISRSRIFGGLPYDIAVLEVDEAYASILVRKVPIRAALVLNVMRDQLDRFGEIDNTAKYLGRLTKAARDVVVLNADDIRVANLPTKSKVLKRFFGASSKIAERLKNDDSFETDTKSPARKADVTLSLSNGYRIGIDSFREVESKFEGVHNHINFAAAFCLLSALMPSRDGDELLSAMTKVSPAFGRGERVVIGDSTFDIQLVKNPSSFTQTIRSVGMSDYTSATVSINDAYADGRDVSWLWDADIEPLKGVKVLFAAGVRAKDMALRLKYADVLVKDVFENEQKMINLLVGMPGVHVIFCTYTSMMSLRKKLVRLGHVERVI